MIILNSLFEINASMILFYSVTYINTITHKVRQNFLRYPFLAFLVTFSKIITMTLLFTVNSAEPQPKTLCPNTNQRKTTILLRRHKSQPPNAPFTSRLIYTKRPRYSLPCPHRARTHALINSFHSR